MADIDDQVGGGIAALEARAAKADARGAAISSGGTSAAAAAEEPAKKPARKAAKKRTATKPTKQQEHDRDDEPDRDGDEERPDKQQSDGETNERDDEDVEEVVGKSLHTNVGRDNPTNQKSAAPSIFGKDRRANLHGRKLHPRDESDQKNYTGRVFLLNTVVDLADEVGLSTQPGKVFDFLIEHALRDVAPDLLARNYKERCDELGVRNDWQ